MKHSTKAPRRLAKPGATARTKFNAGDREQLKAVGATPEQIAKLESVLPMCAALIADVARMEDVREALKEMYDQVSATHGALTGWDKPTTKAKDEARWRVQEAASDADVHDALERAAIALGICRDIIDQARCDLPQQSRRQHRASPAPVARIYRALKDGWAQHLYPTDALPSQVRANIPPPPWFVPDADKSSPFRCAVTICYRAILGDDDYEPVRAMDAFVEGDLRRRTEGPPKI